jgi:hypothetical protein
MRIRVHRVREFIPSNLFPQGSTSTTIPKIRGPLSQLFLFTEQNFEREHSMPKISVVDISDGNNIKELLDDEKDDSDTDADSDVASDLSDLSDLSDESELGVVPRLFFTTFSTLTLLVPLVSAHIALDIIVHEQYSQDFDVIEIAARAVTAALGIS